MKWKDRLKRKRRGVKKGPKSIIYHDLTEEQKEKLTDENLTEFLAHLFNLSLYIDMNNQIRDVELICYELGYTEEAFKRLVARACCKSRLSSYSIIKAIQIRSRGDNEIMKYAKRRRYV